MSKTPRSLTDDGGTESSESWLYHSCCYTASAAGHNATNQDDALQHSKIKNYIAYIAALHAVHQKKFVVQGSKFVSKFIVYMPSRNGQFLALVILSSTNREGYVPPEDA